MNPLHEQIQQAIASLGKLLPNQAPILEFVHFNILEGYQHLPFREALKTAHARSGQAAGYLPDERYREYVKTGRITRHDLEVSLNKLGELDAGEDLGNGLLRREVYLAILLHPIQAITGAQLNWQIDQEAALTRIQKDVDDTARAKLLGQQAEDQRLKAEGKAAVTSAYSLQPSASASANETACVQHLWQSCLQALNLSHDFYHPEELVDLEAERTVNFLRTAQSRFEGDLHARMRTESVKLFDELQAETGRSLSMRGLLKILTGHDILDDIRPALLQHLASFLDQGMAAWHSPLRPQGFYAAWKQSVRHDLNWAFERMPDWRDDIADLPDTALYTVLLELRQLGIPEARYGSYLQCLALELPGWSSMVWWREQHPGYAGQSQPVSTLDYLAVRLVLERLYGNRLCRELWQIEANLDTLRWYCHRRRSEFFVRHALYNRRLPEYLVHLCQHQLAYFSANPDDYNSWKPVADMVLTWLHSPMSAASDGYSLLSHAWPLFRLAQHLGLNGEAIAALNSTQIDSLFACMERLDTDTRGFVWLQALEHNYREQFCAALLANREPPHPPLASASGSPSPARGEGKSVSLRDAIRSRPQAQLIFCMDDREEGIRRHLEEHNPQLETLGAAGFFGVAMAYTGLDDSQSSPLCPVVVTPAHRINEVALPSQTLPLNKHQLRRSQRVGWRNVLHQHSRYSLLTPAIVATTAPLTFGALLARSVSPISFGKISQKISRWFDGEVKTALTLQAESEVAATPANPRLGFTDNEQAERIFNFLRNINLRENLAPLVVMVGHGSISTNNPHMAAYDCGACSGRHGGPNGRAFAAIANRPEVRVLLQERGLDIPADTWFLGAEHNTCDDSIIWYDTDLIPASHQAAFQQLQRDVMAGSQGSAHERCRRLASAPQQASGKQSLRHMQGRATDFSQARPELGHMNHAAAVIGRRTLTQGLFLDRRVFLISYNPLPDPDGAVLEGFLGLNAQVVSTFLDYYFCSVNNAGFGSGSKITHNATGLFGVMDGASSDLRTGLARQMIEIHEPMRPHVFVEAHTHVLAAIYGRQPLLQELVGNGWLLLSAINPDSGEIQNFDPASGFTPWQGEVKPLPIVARSADWYAGKNEPLAPVRVGI